MLNRTTIIGRLTKDVELKKTQTGISVASFSIAFNKRVAKEEESKADFFNCVAWKNTAEYLANYSKKGMLISIDGRLQSRSYDDQEGRKVYVTEIICESCDILTPKSSTVENEDTYEELIEDLVEEL